MVGAGWECKYSNGWPSWLSALSNVWIGGLLWILQALLLWIVDTFEETLTYKWIPLKPEMEKMCLHLFCHLKLLDENLFLFDYVSCYSASVSIT